MRKLISIEHSSIFELEHKKIDIERKMKYNGFKTLLLELEDTFLTCKTHSSSEDDIEVGSGENTKFIKLRPYTLSFLRQMATHF